MNEIKTCKKCGAAKGLNDFHKAANTRDGLHTACKPCRIKANTPQAVAWIQNNRERFREGNRRRYQLKKEKKVVT